LTEALVRRLEKNHSKRMEVSDNKLIIDVTILTKKILQIIALTSLDQVREAYTNCSELERCLICNCERQ